MQPRQLFWRLAALAVLVLPSVFATVASGQTLKQVTKFALPGPGGKRVHYLTIDADARYLISAHLAADQTYVIDLATSRVLATVTDTPGAEGVDYVRELQKLYTPNAHYSTIAVAAVKQ